MAALRSHLFLFLFLPFQRVDLLLQFLEFFFDLTQFLLTAAKLLEVRFFARVTNLRRFVQVSRALSPCVEVWFGEVVFQIRARGMERGFGVFCLFGATFCGLEDLFGIESNCDGFWRVDVNVLCLHHCDVSLGRDLGVRGYLTHI